MHAMIIARTQHHIQRGHRPRGRCPDQKGTQTKRKHRKGDTDQDPFEEGDVLEADLVPGKRLLQPITRPTAVWPAGKR